ncbi:MAG: MBL fold metallo-hydrolase [Kiritimatiellia bacterium]
MENRTWQPIPGMPGAFVYPYVRRPDVLSANSYGIEFPEGRLLIDPGALPPQTNELRRVLSERERERGRARPLLVCATHCHLDHSREVPAWLGEASPPAWLAIQEHGARALAAGDGRQTAADLYGLEMPRMPTHVPLLTAEDVRTGQPRRIRLAADAEALVRTEKRGDAVRQTLEWGNGGAIEILPCAGHSPDSVCFRIGGLLFIGDLLSASRPLIAGLHGWNPEALRQSLADVIRLLEEGSVVWCCPGHGQPLPAEKTLALLRRQRDQAGRTGDIEEMNVQRLFRTVDGALELIDEAEETFAALAGRLLYVANRLEMLDEPELARRCRETFDMDAADAGLQSFRDLCRAFSAGGVPRVAFAVEAAGIVDKLRKNFAPEPLRAFLPAALVNRAQRLLLDFIGIAQGTRNLEEFVPTDVGALLAEIATAWQASPHLDGSIADAADDPDRFAAELARRIGHPPPARRMPVRFEPGSGGPLVPVAAVRFGDMLISFLEWLALAGAATADVAGSGGAARPGVEIRPAGWTPDESPRTRAQLRSFGRRFALAGFELASEPGRFLLRHGAPSAPPR